MDEYLRAIEGALAANREEWFPMDTETRRLQCLRLGREIGYGMAAFDHWQKHVAETFSRLVVRNSFDPVGVPIDMKEWVAAINAGAASATAFAGVQP